MKISIAAETASPEARVPGFLKEAGSLLIVETDSMEVEKVLGAPDENVECAFAQATVDNRCEAILCGEIESDAFEILCGDGVTRLRASGMTATEAVKAMLNFSLDYIKDCIGGHGCSGEEETRRLMEEGALPPNMTVPRAR